MTAKADHSVSLHLKWFHQFQFAGYYAAQMQGYYADAGLTVNIKEFAPGEEPIDSVSAGKSDFGIADATLVLAKLNGDSVVAMAAIFQQSPLALMTLSDSNITSPLDLKGKSVMYRRHKDDAVIASMFSELGISEQDYTYVPHSFDNDALIKGDVDAMSVYITSQPYLYQKAGIDVNLILPANYGIDVYGDLLFTSKEFLLNNPDKALAFREASLRGWHYALNNSEKVIDWMLANMEIKLTKDALIYEAELTRRMIKPDLIELGSLNKNRFLHIASIYQHRKPDAKNGNLDDFLYYELISPEIDYKSITYASWAILAVLLLISSAFWAINKRLKVLVKERTFELEASKKALDKLVITDELTGLGNRRKLNQFFDQELTKAKRYKRPLSIVLIDIDHFKEINDQHGHTCGDLVLKELSQILKTHVRKSDLLGRWGGEEFLIICPETQLSGATQLAELLRKVISESVFPQALSVTCSFGVSQWQEDESSEMLFGQCDRALYQAKDAGRNCVKSA